MTQLRASMGSVALNLPDDAEVLISAGSLALAHGQLELMLRMTIKSLSGLSVREALNATERMKNSDLRKQIDQLFRDKTQDKTLRLKLRAILQECENASDKRNRLLHNAWALGEDGSVVTKGPEHAWGPAPTSEEIMQMANEIGALTETLNRARLEGFIREVCTEE